MTATHNDRHTCTYPWCENRIGDNNEHMWSGTTVHADEVNTYGATTVYAGMILERDDQPLIFLHLQGGRTDMDADIYLTAQAAATLELDLRKAILTAVTSTPAVTR